MRPAVPDSDRREDRGSREPLDRGAAPEPLGFRAGLRAETVPGEGVYLFSETGVTTLRGAGIEALAPLLDGTRDLGALRRSAPAGLPPDAVDRIVGRLREAGLVAPTAPQPPAQAAYWEAAGLVPAAVARATDAAPVQPVSVGGADATAALRALAGTGLRTADAVAHRPGTGYAPADGSALSVVLCGDYLDAGLDEIDAAHRARGRPWLLARPTGARVWIGPFFTPGQGGACWHCLAHRLRFHRQAELRAQRDLRLTGPVACPSPTVPALSSAALGIIALEAAKWTAGHRDGNQRAVWTLDSLTLQTRHHELRARPQCAYCGDPGMVRARTRRPVELHPRPKTADGATGHRSRAAEDVLADFGHLVSPVTGLVKELRADPSAPPGAHIYRSGPNIAAAWTDLEQMRMVTRAENGGKGTTDLHARVSALCEALERHSGAYHGDEEVVRGSYAELADRAVHPDACMLYDPRQYPGRERWNAEHGPFQHVCDPFDDHSPLDWTPVWSLTGERTRLLPTALLYFGAPHEPGWAPVVADSNGNAAGTSLEDAVLQGALELVERDAVALWWYNRTRQPGVDLDAFADPWVDRMREAFAGAGRRLWVLDVTSDLGVPAMAAVYRNTGPGPQNVMFGFGAHLDARTALRRAVAEACQMIPCAEGVRGSDDPDAARWLAGPGTDGAPYLLPDPQRRPLRPADYTGAAGGDLAADVRTLRDRFAAAGLETLVLDQTRPDIGLPVAKVIVPGLRGFWSRFAPGRLFDVPVELGRLTAPTPYEELNPVPIFL
ncbi:TOMM precursor leader peptide-binding protein [Nocardiopsis baichengensis]|uniref:TOMM precursor leader peptide-binding protein n=1 Tax=Nocardiopsis baichengensis TaxID=280240 RepID=UPI0003487267|nr:TOMM precursor leader peptide-binding protein [Nocardiopsis baichengensis]